MLHASILGTNSLNSADVPLSNNLTMSVGFALELLKLQ